MTLWPRSDNLITDEEIGSQNMISPRPCEIIQMAACLFSKTLGANLGGSSHLIRLLGDIIVVTIGFIGMIGIAQ